MSKALPKKLPNHATLSYWLYVAPCFIFMVLGHGKVFSASVIHFLLKRECNTWTYLLVIIKFNSMVFVLLLFLINLSIF